MALKKQRICLLFIIIVNLSIIISIVHMNHTSLDRSFKQENEESIDIQIDTEPDKQTVIVHIVYCSLNGQSISFKIV